MEVSITLPSGTIDLAGGYGVSSQTSAFGISTEGNHQKSDVIGSDEARQFFRGGSLTSVRFNSRNTFDDLGAAEAYLLGLPASVKDQEGATASIKTTSKNAMTVAGTTSPDMNGQAIVAQIIDDRGVYNNPLDLATPNTQLFVNQFTPGSVFWSISHSTGLANWEWHGPTYASVDLTEETPDLVASWTAVDVGSGLPTGTPTVTASTFNASTLDLYDVQAIINASHNGATVDLSCVITGRTVNPSP